MKAGKVFQVMREAPIRFPPTTSLKGTNWVWQGGVGLRIKVYDWLMCFLNCHLAAHSEAVNCRNTDFDHIFRNMVFNSSFNLLNSAAAILQKDFSKLEIESLFASAKALAYENVQHAFLLGEKVRHKNFGY